MTKEEETAVARMIARYYIAFLEDSATRTGTITEQPEAQPLLAALREAQPNAGGLLEQMCLVFSGGVSAGLDIAEHIHKIAR